MAKARDFYLFLEDPGILKYWFLHQWDFGELSSGAMRDK
jgi:hypothetical protein